MFPSIVSAVCSWLRAEWGECRSIRVRIQFGTRDSVTNRKSLVTSRCLTRNLKILKAQKINAHAIKTLDNAVLCASFLMGFEAYFTSQHGWSSWMKRKIDSRKVSHYWEPWSRLTTMDCKNALFDCTRPAIRPAILWGSAQWLVLIFPYCTWVSTETARDGKWKCGTSFVASVTYSMGLVDAKPCVTQIQMLPLLRQCYGTNSDIHATLCLLLKLIA